MVQFVPAEDSVKFSPVEGGGNDVLFAPVSEGGNVLLPEGRAPQGMELLTTPEGRANLLSAIKQEPGRILDALVNMAKYPGEVAAGEKQLPETYDPKVFDSRAEEAISKSLEIAMTTIGTASKFRPPAAAKKVESIPPEEPPPPPPASLITKTVETADDLLIRDVETRGMRSMTTSPELEALRIETDKVTSTPAIQELSQIAPQLVQPIVKETFSRDINNVILGLLDEGKVRMAPDIKIADQVRDLLQTNIINPDKFNAILEKHGVSPVRFIEELTQSVVGKGVKETATEAGRVLQQLSELRKTEIRIRELAGEKSPELAAALKLAKSGDDISTAGMSYIQRTGNIWKGLLVSQLATHIRNAETQTARIGLDTYAKGLEFGLRSIFGNPMRKLLGKEPISDPIAVFGEITTVLGPRRAANIANALADAYPKTVREALRARYSSDVATASGGKGIFSKIERAVDLLNTVERMKENFFRRAYFAESLTRRLAAEGKSIDDIVANNRLGSIDKKHIEGAVTDALEKTWGQPIGSDAFGKFMHGINSALTFGDKIPNFIAPFMRFMTSAMRYQFEYSPLGAVRLLHPLELKGFVTGEAKQLNIAAKALAGSSLLYGAYLIRNSEMAGPQWFELKLPDGRMIDARPFAPFSFHLFVADIIKRTQDGTLLGMSGKEIAQGLIGVNFRAGAGLYIVDRLIDELAGLDSLDKAGNVVKTFAGDILAGFLTPFQMLKDVAAEFIPEEKTVRDTKQHPLTGPARARVPFASQALPEAISPTRSEPLQRESPLLRQMTGITLRSKPNDAEAELGRLGFKRKDILPSSGDVIFDYLTAKRMGPLVEKVIVPFVNSPGYQAIESNKVQALVLSKTLPFIRKIATAQAKTDDAAAALRERFGNLSKRERAVIEDELNKRGMTFNLPE